MNTPEQNIVNLLTNKKVLFLENDNSLSYGLIEFENILKRHNIEYKVLYSLEDDHKLEDILNEINQCDCIVFMTQWVYDISKILFNYVSNLEDKKIIVEVFLREPTWYYASQHGTHHDVFIYSCDVDWGEVDKDTEEFYKLTDKAYWNYENNFDK